MFINFPTKKPVISKRKLYGLEENYRKLKSAEIMVDVFLYGS